MHRFDLLLSFQTCTTKGRRKISLQHCPPNFLNGIESIPNSNSKIGAQETAILFWAFPPLAPPLLRPHLRDSHSDAAQLICYSVRCAKQVSTVFNWIFYTCQMFSHKNLIGGWAVLISLQKKTKVSDFCNILGTLYVGVNALCVGRL